MIAEFFSSAQQRISNSRISDGSHQELQENLNVRIKCSGDLVLLSTNYANMCSRADGIGIRSRITEFSESSARRMRSYLRECAVDYYGMVTLTYPHGHGFDAGRSKRDLKVFLQRIARSNPKIIGLLPLSVFWFIEFQDRGSIHFHLFTNAFIDKAWAASVWYEICGTDDERHLRAGTRCEKFRQGRHGFRAYASKYAAKHVQKVVPSGFGWVGRYWGISGYRAVVSASTYFSASTYANQTYKFRIGKLDDLIENGMFEGKIKVVKVIKSGDYEDLVILKVMNLAWLHNIFACINHLETLEAALALDFYHDCRKELVNMDMQCP